MLARYWFVVSFDGSCGVQDDLHGYRYAADCNCASKPAEGVNVAYHFNECGYRTEASCGPKPANTLRLAVMGASTAEGFKVPYARAFAPELAQFLDGQCGQPVEIQNLGVAGYHPLDQYWLIDEALNLHPDLLLLVLTPYELAASYSEEQMRMRFDPEQVRARNRARSAQPETGSGPSLISRIDALLADSRAVLAAQHILYQNRQKFVSLFLLHEDKADYLRSPLSAKWQKRLQNLEILFGEMADKAHAAGVPFVIVLGPQRIQAALLDQSLRQPGVDPFLLGEKLAEIAGRHGIVFYDLLADFRQQPEPERLFYPVDGHMTEAGHRLFANAIDKHLLQAELPVLKHCRAPESHP